MSAASGFRWSRRRTTSVRRFGAASSASACSQPVAVCDVAARRPSRRTHGRPGRRARGYPGCRCAGPDLGRVRVRSCPVLIGDDRHVRRARRRDAHRRRRRARRFARTARGRDREEATPRRIVRRLRAPRMTLVSRRREDPVRRSPGDRRRRRRSERGRRRSRADDRRTERDRRFRPLSMPSLEEYADAAALRRARRRRPVRRRRLPALARSGSAPDARTLSAR